MREGIKKQKNYIKKCKGGKLMKKITLVLFTLAITLIFTFNSFAKDAYIQHDLDKLAKKAEKRLKVINKELKKQEKEEKIRKKLDELNNLYIQAEILYDQGKYKEAKALYLKLKQYVKDSDVKLAAHRKRKELEKLKKKKQREEKEKKKAGRKRRKKSRKKEIRKK